MSSLAAAHGPCRRAAVAGSLLAALLVVLVLRNGDVERQQALGPGRGGAATGALLRRRLLLYQPIAGLGNQLIELEIGLRLARELNRTLVVPRYVGRDGAVSPLSLADLVQVPAPPEPGVDDVIQSQPPTADEVIVLTPTFVTDAQRAYLQKTFPWIYPTVTALRYFRELGLLGPRTVVRTVNLTEPQPPGAAGLLASDARVLGLNMLFYLYTFWGPLTIHLPPHPRFCVPASVVPYSAVHLRMGDMPEYGRVMLNATIPALSEFADRVAQLHQRRPEIPWYVASDDDQARRELLQRTRVPELGGTPTTSSDEHAVLLRDVCLCWHADVWLGASYSTLSTWIGTLRRHDHLTSHWV